MARCPATYRTGTVLRQEGNDGAYLSLAMNKCDAAGENLFAATHGTRATIYDDRHCGKHMALVMQYTHEKELDLAAWVPTDGATDAPLGDHRLAVTGPDDHNVYVISVAETRVVSLLENGKARVRHMAGAPGIPNVLFAALVDGSLKAFDVNTEAELAVCPDATARHFAIWAPASADVPPAMLVADGKGLKVCALRDAFPPLFAEEGDAVGAKRKRASANPLVVEDLRLRDVQLQDREGAPRKAEPFEVVHALNATSFLTLSSRTKRVVVWDWLEDGDAANPWLSATARVRCEFQAAGFGSGGFGTKGSYATRWGFGTTSDGRLLSCAAPGGSATVVDLATGKVLNRLEHPMARVGYNKECFGAVMSDDARSVICSCGDGFLFRHEACDVPAAPENEDGEAPEGARAEAAA